MKVNALYDELKDLLGEIPYSAELYWYLRQRNTPTTVKMDLKPLKEYLPGWTAEAAQARPIGAQGKKVVVFGMTHIWIQHTCLLSLALAGMGHEVLYTFVPYDHWGRAINKFDLRRQNVYIKETLKAMQPLVAAHSLYDLQPKDFVLSEDIRSRMAQRAYHDSQYTTAVEEVDITSPVYQMRLERDLALAKTLLAWLPEVQPDVVITPNGSVMEYGVVYEICTLLGIPVMTYEFGEQDQRLWLAQNADVMRQDTTDMWQARGKIPLTDRERERVEELFASRQSAQLWKTFFRQWQRTPAKGEDQIRADLKLDDRPIAFVATNVLGDSLTLRRQNFSGITNWLKETVRYFSTHPEYQLVVRVHPGEKLSWGRSVYDILAETFPTIPENIHLIRADAKVNSYDLVAIADLGMVYTTTMGLEMAMGGLPVVVVGQTHYWGKGFTLDPGSWEEYYRMVEEVLQSPAEKQLTKEQVDLAWRYAYRFFFEYALPYPWHLFHFQNTIADWPLQRTLGKDGQERFGSTFRYLLGEPIDWNAIRSVE